MRRVGTSLEVLLQTKPGSKVSVHPDGNHVNLVVDKKLEARTLDGDSGYEPNSSQEQQLFHDSQQSRQTRLDSAPTDASSNSRASSGETAHTTGNWSPPIDPMSDLPPEPFPKQAADGTLGSASQIEVQAEDEGVVASIFSGTSVFLVMALGLFGLIVS